MQYPEDYELWFCCNCHGQFEQETISGYCQLCYEKILAECQSDEDAS